MVGKKDSMSLVEEYRRLQREILRDTSGGMIAIDPGRRMDAIYVRIISNPVVDIHAALEKLWFAHHCLTEEGDYKEASNLIYQVCVGLEVLSRKAPDDASVA